MTSKLSIKKKDNGNYDISINGKTMLEHGLLVTSLSLYMDAKENLPKATLEVVFIDVEIEDIEVEMTLIGS
jgi:hypothetical protein